MKPIHWIALGFGLGVFVMLVLHACAGEPAAVQPVPGIEVWGEFDAAELFHDDT